MTSGRKNTPTETQCQTCGKTLMWIGGRPPKYCNHHCRYWHNRTPKKRMGLTDEQKAQDKRNKAIERRRKHKAIADQAKLDRQQCCDCGLQITLATLPCIAFDHRDPQNKSFTISYELGRKSDQQIIDEIAKCDAVCHNCHAIRTHNNKHWNVRRG